MHAEDMISGFIEELRRRGLRLSPSEQIDASRAALVVGVESRPRFRAALCSTLAKTPADRALFSEAFDAWFAPPRGSAGNRPGRSASPGGGGARGRGRPPEGDPEPGRAGSSRRAPTARGQPPPLRPRRKGAAPPVAADITSAERPRSRLRKILTSRPSDRRGEGRPRDLSRPEGHRSGEEADPRRRDLILPAGGEEEARLAAAAAAVIREIRLRRGRRFARGPRGRLWVKKVVRESLAHGGVPFVLPMKERRPRRPRLLLLVDVSHSVLRASGLFLLICRGLQEWIDRAAIHLFVDRICDATEAIRKWSPGPIASRGGDQARRRHGPGEAIRPHAGAASFAEIVRSLPHLDPAAPSDYGRAFYQARSVLLRSGGRDTVLVVLGDARTNRRDPLSWAFEEVASRCRRVLWLNPEPRALWDTGDSVMSVYLPSCDLACEVRDLDALAAGVRQILRSL